MRYTPRHLHLRTGLAPLTRLTVALALVATSTAVGGAATAHALDNGNSNDKQTICHATSSNTNPYVVNTPDKNGDVSGHADHDGPVWDPTLKAQHITWGDIIPPFDYNDHGTPAHFAGQNYGTEGKAIFAAGCTLPRPPLSLSVVKTNDANTNGTYTDDETATAVGAPVSFQLDVTNTSAVTVTIDSVTDVVGTTTIPVSCSFVGTTLAAGATKSCTFTVAGYTPADGASKTNTATVRVHEGVDGDENLDNKASASDTSVVRTALPVAPKLSLTVVKTNDADKDGVFHGTETAAAAGQDVKYEALITNTSDVAVTVDSISDVVGSAGSVPVTCLPAFPTTLAAHAFATCSFTLTAASPAAGSSLLDTVTAVVHQTGNPDNSTSGSGSSTVITAETPEPSGTPDTSIVKVGPMMSLQPGGTATYTLTVTNTGTAPALNVVVDDVVPAGTSLTSVVAPGFSCAPVGVHCTYNGPLDVDGTGTVTVVVTLDPTYSLTSLSNTATVGPTDGTPEDNTSTVTTPVVLPAADLSIVKTGPANVVRGETISWSLVVSNSGNAAATTVQVTDSLAAGLTLVSASGSGWTCTGTGTVTCSLDAPLGAGANATVTIVAGLASGYVPSTVTNTAVVGPTDVTPDDNTSTVTTPVVSPLVPVTGGGGGIATGGGFNGGGNGAVGSGTGASGAGGGGLPFTGAPLDNLFQLAPGLMFLGLLLLTAGRRRTAA